MYHTRRKPLCFTQMKALSFVFVIDRLFGRVTKWSIQIEIVLSSACLSQLRPVMLGHGAKEPVSAMEPSSSAGDGRGPTKGETSSR